MTSESAPLLGSSPTTRRIARLYSGELPEEERDNLNNELQEESEYREEYEVENSDTESLLPEVVITEFGTTRLPSSIKDER